MGPPSESDGTQQYNRTRNNLDKQRSSRRRSDPGTNRRNDILEHANTVNEINFRMTEKRLNFQSLSSSFHIQKASACSIYTFRHLGAIIHCLLYSFRFSSVKILLQPSFYVIQFRGNNFAFKTQSDFPSSLTPPKATQ